MLLTCMKEEEEECDVVIGRSMRAENDVFLRSVSKQDTKHFLGEHFFDISVQKKIEAGMRCWKVWPVMTSASTSTE